MIYIILYYSTPLQSMTIPDQLRERRLLASDSTSGLYDELMLRGTPQSLGYATAAYVKLWVEIFEDTLSEGFIMYNYRR